MKWEYKYLHVDAKISDKKTVDLLNQELNKMGEEGWELVNFTTILVDVRYAFVFKRRKEEGAS